MRRESGPAAETLLPSQRCPSQNAGCMSAWQDSRMSWCRIAPSLLQCLRFRVAFTEQLGAKFASVGVRRGAPAAYV